MSATVQGLVARLPPYKRRRTATSVLAGDHDPHPPRDVLTSLLNGVGPYKLVEGDPEERKRRRRDRRELKRREKKNRAKDRKLAGKMGGRARPGLGDRAQSVLDTAVAAEHGSDEPTVNSSTSSFWRIRGPPIVATRSVSPTPPPEFSAPPTPGPSISSTVSVDSSRRLHTPEDGTPLLDQMLSVPPSLLPIKVRKKRAAAKKGWKGWVEGSPPPSDKLINLDAVPIMVERRTRSGKNFDAISEGTDTWVKLAATKRRSNANGPNDSNNINGSD